MRKNLIFMIGAAALLTACSEEAAIVHDVTYFREHEGERIAMIERCNNSPGLYDTDPNCVNAEEAARQVRLANRRAIFESMGRANENDSQTEE